jgi:HD-GYP domain-containing protein (c-di-GMP phosphodiesterase class II)
MPVTGTSANASHLLKVSSNDVLVGMYITEMDCNWSDTPFPLGGFHVKNAEEIQILQKYARVLTIDINKGAEPPKRRRSNLTILSSARRAAPQVSSLKVNRDAYPVTQPVKKQIDKSHAAYTSLKAIMADAAAAVRKGEALPLDALRKPAAELIDSILANPQTLIWILGTEHEPGTANAYCVRAAIWAAMLSRQFGLSRADIDCLFQGTLLADIGMNLLPERLVNKRGPFRKKELLAYRKHVEFGVELLQACEEMDERVIQIVRSHHERHDGRGFPMGFKGKQIPALARFTSLAYCFERLLRSNDPARRVSPARAISRLYKQRELKFPEQLVVEFIHIMGTYPIGSLVELASGELALVWEQNNEERLSPTVAIITDGQRQKLAKPRLMDLSSQKANSANLTISRSVNPGGLAIDTSQYCFALLGKRISVAGFGFRL